MPELPDVFSLSAIPFWRYAVIPAHGQFPGVTFWTHRAAVAFAHEARTRFPGREVLILRRRRGGAEVVR